MRRAQYIIRRAARDHRGLSNTHPYRTSSIPVAKGFTHINHTGCGEPYLSSRSTLSYVRAVSCHHTPGRIFIIITTASRGGSLTHCRGKYQILSRHLIRNLKIIYETARYPQTRIEQPYTTKQPPYSVRDTIGREQLITNCQLKRQIPNSKINHCQGKTAIPTSILHLLPR